MKSLLSILVLTLCNQILWAAGAPNNMAEMPVRYDDAQLWKVEHTGLANNILDELQRNSNDVSIWNSNKEAIDVFVTKPAIDETEQRLNEANIQYEVIVEDYQKVIDEENISQAEIEFLQSRAKHNLTWEAYHRLNDIYHFLDYLVAKHPKLCSVKTIGKSFEGRPLKVIKVSNGNAENKAIWIDGGIHAREWVSPASVTYILNDLVSNWNEHPEFIRNITWYIQPSVNPDGYEFSHQKQRLWRKNRSNSANHSCVGVDLNRNFGYKWGGAGTSANPCSEIYRGESAFSEPESLAQKKFIETILTKQKIHAFLSFHSYGQYILHSWGFDTSLPEDHADLKRAGDEAAAKIYALDQKTYTVGGAGAVLYPAAGGSDDWAKSIGIKYSYTIELRDTGRYGFVLPAKYIIDTAKEALAAVHVLAKHVTYLE